MSAPGTDTAIYTPPDADGIAVVTLDHFPVNSLSTNVMNGVSTLAPGLSPSAPPLLPS